MKQNTSKFVNIYCDESRVENIDSNIMVIGALIIPRGQKRNLEKGLQDVRRRFGFRHEIKWTKTGGKYLDFYKEIIDYFIDSQDMGFRCIVVDKRKLNYAEFHNNDEELAFFKFYYLMLRKKLLDYKRYYVILDKKPTRDKNRARALQSFLDSYVLLHKRECSIEHLQAYHSHDILFLQIADFLTGLVGYAVNVLPKTSSVKNEVVQYLKTRLNRGDFLSSSALSEDKFNIFVWTPECELK